MTPELLQIHKNVEHDGRYHILDGKTIVKIRVQTEQEEA